MLRVDGLRPLSLQEPSEREQSPEQRLKDKDKRCATYYHFYKISAMGLPISSAYRSMK